MVKALLSYMPFPSVTWWAAASMAGELLLDDAERYRKMGGHNRYRIAAANGPLLLTIPLVGGRDQRSSVGALRIDYRQDWVKQHWRTLFSAYGRAPFFEHYGPPLQQILEAKQEQLTDLCRATITWMMRELRWQKSLQPVNAIARELPADVRDLRQQKGAQQGRLPRYPQVFEQRYGFVPNLSLIDLLMNEGPAAAVWLQEHGPAIAASVGGSD